MLCCWGVEQKNAVDERHADQIAEEQSSYISVKLYRLHLNKVQYMSHLSQYFFLPIIFSPKLLMYKIFATIVLRVRSEVVLEAIGTPLVKVREKTLQDILHMYRQNTLSPYMHRAYVGHCT